MKLSKLKLLTASIILSTHTLFFVSSCSETKYKIDSLNIIGSLDGISKNDSVKVKVRYKDKNQNVLFDADATLKWQGNFSLRYNKKNFTIELFKPNTDYSEKYKISPCEGWPKDNKFTLKANYCDFLSSHLIVGDRVWGDIIHLTNPDPNLNQLLYGGGIDGFPIALYHNNKCLGLYTWNQKLNKKLFSIEDSAINHQAILQANFHDDIECEEKDEQFKSTYFKKTIEDMHLDGWDLEGCSTEDDSWVLPSFNNFIDFVMHTDDAETFKQNLPLYTNVDCLLSYIVYVTFTYSWDNVGNNIVWVTYDGNRWLPIIYDNEYSWGLGGGGVAGGDNDFSSYIEKSLLLSKVVEYYQPELQERYTLLLNNKILSQVAMNKFASFSSLIPNNLYKKDEKLWPADLEHRSIADNTLENIQKFINERIEHFK